MAALWSAWTLVGAWWQRRREGRIEKGGKGVTKEDTEWIAGAEAARGPKVHGPGE